MEPLALKDIHLPEAIGWWPPAPGWYLLSTLMVLSMLAGYYAYRRLNRKTAINRARTLLQQIRQQQTDPLHILADLSALLRRVAVNTDPRAGVAQLYGPAWLDYLDRKLPDAPFSQGLGRCLADAHYRPALAEDIDLEAVFALCERWLKQQGRPS